VRNSSRLVAPEILDQLAPDDPRARRSRRDLRSVHRVMGTAATLRHALSRMSLAIPLRRVLELGAGDGSLLLRVARRLRPPSTPVELVLLDRHDLVETDTVDAYAAIGWAVTVVQTDVLDWARQSDGVRYDLCVASLFLHHFEAAELSVILSAVAARATAFVACEPRRDGLAPVASRLVGFIGANSVTRDDAVTSVAAGFSGRELADAWPVRNGRWTLDEYSAGAFSHCFTAVRTPNTAGGYSDVA
jgi:hypothetical protein